MLHTFWVTEFGFSRMEEYIDSHGAELYIIHAQQDVLSSRYVLLVECSERVATYLRLLED
jgi:hypothetical protein